MTTALITGASAGIGAELAKVCAAKNHDLVLVARRRNRLEELSQSLKEKHGISVHIIACDLTEPDSPQNVFKELNELAIEVDYLINNAGFGSNGPFLEQDRARELNQIQLNVASLVNLTHLFANEMVKRNRGAVMNIASTAAFQSGPRMAVYYATKAFVLSFSEALAYELKNSDVTVTAHCPGATESEFGAEAGNDTSLLFKMGVASADSVAKHAYKSMMRGDIIAIPGLVNWLGAWSVRFTPRFVLRWLVSRLNR